LKRVAYYRGKGNRTFGYFLGSRSYRAGTGEIANVPVWSFLLVGPVKLDWFADCEAHLQGQG